MGSHDTKKNLDALQRIFNRRGKVSILTCDGAGEFQAGAKHLEALGNHLKKINLKYKLGRPPYNIRFNLSTYAPWYNAIESTVKLAKQAFTKSVGRQKIHCFFQFSQHLSDTEMILNSRPLSYLSEDIAISKNEDTIITPFLLLQGRSYQPLEIDFKGLNNDDWPWKFL